METKNLTIETGAGDTFSEVSAKAKRLATNRKSNVEFDFNGIKCIVSANTNLDYLYRDYSNSWTMDWKIVGPDCLEQYTSEVESELQKRNQEREIRRSEEQKQQVEADAKQKNELETKLQGIVFDSINPEEYASWKDKNSDPYDSCCFEYAEGWARLMQFQIANGKEVKDIAETTSHELGYLGITGFMYGMAVNILSKCWRHGEELRKWHNKEYNHEGDGVVNPAILNISL